MFRCEKCQKVSEPREVSHKVVTETREVEYPYREYANKKDVLFDPRGTDDPGGVGHETVKEITVCGECAEKMV